MVSEAGESGGGGIGPGLKGREEGGRPISFFGGGSNSYYGRLIFIHHQC